MGRLFLCALLLVAGALAQDACLDYSFAVPAVQALAQNTALGLTTTPQQGISYVWNVMQGVTSPYAIKLFFGLANGDVFMVANCHILEATQGIAQYCAAAGTSFVAQIRHSSYGDSYRRFFGIDATGTLMAQVGIESTPYNTTGRLWYIQGNGWSPAYTSFTGGIIQSFATSFPPPAGGQTGVVAADRTPREPCNACLESSWIVPVVTEVALNFLPFMNVQTWAGVQAAFHILQTTVQQGNRGYSHYLLVGMSNKDVYELYDCSNPLNVDKPFPCSASYPWLAILRNDYLAANQNIGTVGMLTYFPMTSSGTIGSAIAGASIVYDITTRPFYTSPDGWTAPFPFIGTIYTGRSFSRPAMNVATGQVIGVVSGSVATVDPCSGFYVATPCPS